MDKKRYKYGKCLGVERWLANPLSITIILGLVVFQLTYFAIPWDQIFTGKTEIPITNYQSSLCLTNTNYSARYDIDPLSYGKPKTFSDVEEVFDCDCSHWRTSICTLKGDIRIDASKNLVMLYANNNKTLRRVQSIKPYTRNWEEEVMKGAHDVIIKSMDSPSGLQSWVPTDPAINSSGPWKGTRNLSALDFKLGNSTDWSEAEWNEKLAKRLWSDETQLSEIEWRREKIGQVLLNKGLVFVKNGVHAWVMPNVSGFMTEEQVRATSPVLRCDVNHSAPGIVFSTTGWTGNVYHDFNDGLIPLYVTANQFGREFVMIISEPKLWWFVKYEFVLKKLSNYPVVLLGQEELVHCFQHVIVGLRIHDELTVYPQLLPTGNGSIVQFQKLLKQAWFDESLLNLSSTVERKPLMCIIGRHGKSRVLTNEKELVALSEKLGFRVEVMNPTRVAYMKSIFTTLQASDVMIGVHGAAMTYFLFMRPNSSFFQILPLGTDWPAKTYYGDPAIRLGLHYLEYKIDIEESSLSKEYPKNHSVLLNPDSVRVEKGWWEFKEIFLERQNVTLNLTKMEGFLDNVLVQYKQTTAS